MVGTAYPQRRPAARPKRARRRGFRHACDWHRTKWCSPEARSPGCGSADQPGGGPLGHAIGHLIQELTLAFARRDLTFVVHSSTRGTRSLREIWKALTPAAVLALKEFSESDAAAMQAAGIEVIIGLYDTAEPGPAENNGSDHSVGAVQARHLAATHRRLGYAYPDDERVAIFAEPRLAGVRRVCAELGLPAPDVRTVPLEPGRAAEAVQGWLAADPPVTGICGFNDDVAMAVLAGLRRLGRQAPADLAVIGVDDIPNAAVAAPPLTTVVQDFTAIAEHYADTVTAALEGGHAAAEPPEHRTRLEIRESA
jgi:DNA-binding LacI/PurR family transcriptional regulator